MQGLDLSLLFIKLKTHLVLYLDMHISYVTFQSDLFWCLDLCPCTLNSNHLKTPLYFPQVLSQPCSQLVPTYKITCTFLLSLSSSQGNLGKIDLEPEISPTSSFYHWPVLWPLASQICSPCWAFICNLVPDLPAKWLFFCIC